MYVIERLEFLIDLQENNHLENFGVDGKRVLELKTIIYFWLNRRCPNNITAKVILSKAVYFP